MIKNLGNTYTLMSEVYDVYNKIYGWHGVLLNINVLIGLLSPIALAIVYTTPKSTQTIVGATYGIDLLLLCIVWGGMIFILGVTIAACCFMTMQETDKIGYTLFKIMYNTPAIPFNSDFKRRVFAICQATSMNYPTFSASNVFVVDFSMLYNVLGSVVSYVVVIVQFNNY